MAHKAKALVLSCIDFRFQKMIEDFIETDMRALRDYDHVAVAGAVRQLVNPVKPEFQEYLLEQIRISVSLHTPDVMYLINHEDCGAYGEDNSRETHESDLRNAYTLLKEKYPQLDIKLFIATFDGLVEVNA